MHTYVLFGDVAEEVVYLYTLRNFFNFFPYFIY